MVSRFAIVTVGAISLLLTGLYLRSFESGQINVMSESQSSVPIEVTLSVPPSSSSNLGAASIRVTITNNSPHTVWILSWSSPVDARAVVTGMFKFISTTTNKPAPCLDMKINRRMPDFFLPDDDAIVEVPAKGTYEKDFIAKEPEVALTKGDRYRVKTEGWWMRVWVHDGSTDAAKLEVESAISGDFVSNEIEVDIAEA
ncbi:hypothetical protein GLAREA_03564 [Glarea lozoyensis ATCC 20868]|uniref:Uncharacterized protein n=1 Tax=Glarea lozoyensis (strain ATCC 20868 / MF5171) TaxID=1116229 RepID=S3CW08_GLAL2|nr:uncharacterized protein GLAREA_03564 [Glarea lozoyensis ATCC 20868]EPE30597.1 hypothetical protein GLAREA_03564 [Glarea lozoyensis ATCC 20868]